MSDRSRLRLIVVLVVAAGLFIAAVSNAVYELTSPAWLSWHVLLRKGYSIVAFGALAAGAAPLWPDDRSRRWLPAVMGAYSGAIELGQYLHGGREGLAWNAIDVACGAAGGLIGLVANARLRQKMARGDRPLGLP